MERCIARYQSSFLEVRKAGEFYKGQGGELIERARGREGRERAAEFKEMSRFFFNGLFLGSRKGFENPYGLVGDRAASLVYTNWRARE